MDVPALIGKKRDGHELTREEIAFLIDGFISGAIADHQMSAWAMAVFFKGMTAEETRDLTTAMMETGSVLSYPKSARPKVDQYSAGGIGDKTTLVLAPLLACDDKWVPMISGRGVGSIGTALDKLESIPGFNVHIDERRALAQLKSIGVFMIEESADLCPAGKKLGALCDATGSATSRPLRVASVMSRKLAENLNQLVLDLKFGRGASLKTRKEAQQLADAMTEVGELMGVKVTHLIEAMDQPLGRTVGNALEIAECVEVLQGRGPEDVTKHVLDLAEQVATANRAQLASWLEDGTAWKKFISMVYAQDGDASTLEKLDEVHRAPIIQPFPAKSAGTVRKMDAEVIGRISLLLGAGRRTAGDSVDYAVGLSGIKKVGERVTKGEPVFTVHARTEQALRLVKPLFEEAVELR